MHSKLLAAAITGLVLGATSLAQAQTTNGTRAPLGSDDLQQLDTSDAGAKHGCKGQNACKGQGGCKTDKNACKGHNACKGQGGCKTDSPKTDKNACAGKGGCGTK